MKSLLSFTGGLLAALFLIQPSGNLQPPVKVNLMASDVVVVQYNAGWNAANTVKGLEKLTECTYFYCDVEKQPMYLASQKVKQVPTVIIYSKGKEVKRWEGDLFMKNPVTLPTIQGSVRSF